MSTEVINLNSFLSGLERLKKEPEKIVRRKLEVVLRLVHQGVTSRTPVYTGKSLRNWVWTMDQPSASSDLPALGSGDPGHTGSMPLGAEPRRPANQAAVDASFATLDLSKPMRSFWLSNNSENIVDLEYGMLPTPGRSRNPAGMVGVTFEEVLQALRSA